MSSDQNSNPALDVVKRNTRDEAGKEITLSTGIRAILTPVASSLIIEAQSEIEDPIVPMQEIEGKPGKYENPHDPDYLKAKKKAEKARVEAGIDTMIIMGVELVDGLPENDGWIKKLKYLEKRGRISLKGYDLKDELDREFLYKRHIAMSSDDWMLLNEISGIRQADLDTAGSLF
jgi:hypothetical protein